MKFATTLALAMAPLSLAVSVRDPKSSFLPSRRDHPEGDKGDGKGSDKGKDVGNVIELDLSNSDGYKKYKGGDKTQVIIIWVNSGNGAETTTVNEKVTVTQTVTAGAGDGAVATTPAAAASHTVTVGGPGGLVFQPDQLDQVPIGDTVIFEFLSQNHTVSQSAFDTPCDILEGGMDSGFMPNPNNTVSPAPQVAMQVMVDTPLWFYCKQSGHCGKGMVFSINPTADKTQAMFQALAIKQKGEGAETPITDPAATPGQGEAEAPAASTTVASAPEGTQALTPGEGTLGSDGSCVCIVSCAAGSFPAEAQGLGAFGGQPGGMAIKMAAL
ncbi:hypothetical protein AK830_g738 [Neonectria ditissima]|uniref:Phytocyanin domain-containing protein n=1 Tax=Neonectria ditissima TaxID=78410 RepID=A0A0P7BP89_9HYPO|nr:hypothetical protein AK830_g738 [Neonectria ditissima]